ncbi:ferritin-like domain-containing protein [Halorubellus salinus]|uniref:ferritin-like domain-containing protein n=1 Tax=Halorubellus salinus TaxID=755309 RepID=UPI001D07CA9D|nr:ferritin-like domain-containing protein [Halorubellus salinus]
MTEKHGPLVREPETGDRRQEWGTIAENAVRMDPSDAEAVVDALSVDHAGSFNLFYLLRKHHWTAEGTHHEAVGDFLADAAQRVREMNDEVAVRIVELGGIPPNTPPTIQERAEVHLEAEDRYDLRASLAGDLEGYATLLAGMRDHVELVERRGDQTSGTLLRDHLDALEPDADTIQQLLEADTLVRPGVLQ